MAWTTPATATVGQLVTSAFWNAQVRDNLSALNISRGEAATVGAAQTTASTSYTDLATAGPAVTLTTGTSVWVDLGAELNHNSVRHYISVAVSGASTVSAATNDGAGNRLLVINADTYQDNSHSFGFAITGLTAGSNTFTLKYKVDSGTGTFGYRMIHVKPLGVIA